MRAIGKCLLTLLFPALLLAPISPSIASATTAPTKPSNLLACQTYDAWYHDESTKAPISTKLADAVLTNGQKADSQTIRMAVQNVLSHPNASQTQSANYMYAYGVACNELNLGPTLDGKLPGDLAACNSMNTAYTEIGVGKATQAESLLETKTVALGEKAEDSAIQSDARNLHKAFGTGQEKPIATALRQFATTCYSIKDWNGPH
jgi:hypothetical protein